MELACLLSKETVVIALQGLDEKFGWEKQPSIVLEVITTLLHSTPTTKPRTDLTPFVCWTQSLQHGRESRYGAKR